MTTYVALLGHPVAHSLSPRMQNAAFAAADLDWEYVLRDVLPEDLEGAVREVEYANVTAPYKRDVGNWLELAGGLGTMLNGVQGQIGKILSQSQLKAMYDSGFEWSEYLGLKAPWEQLKPPPPRPK